MRRSVIVIAVAYRRPMANSGSTPLGALNGMVERKRKWFSLKRAAGVEPAPSALELRGALPVELSPRTVRAWISLCDPGRREEDGLKFRRDPLDFVRRVRAELATAQNDLRS